MNLKLLGLLVLFFIVLGSNTVSAREPWEEPQDTTTAMNNPDLYAWQLFTSLNWPADSRECSPDKSKKLGDPGEVTWETWPTKQDTFLAGAKTKILGR